jgi:hypothetical protein
LEENHSGNNIEREIRPKYRIEALSRKEKEQNEINHKEANDILWSGLKARGKR